jgi:hypothetical protein
MTGEKTNIGFTAAALTLSPLFLCICSPIEHHFARRFLTLALQCRYTAICSITKH